MSKLPSIAVPITRRSTKKGPTATASPVEQAAPAPARRHPSPTEPLRQHRYRIGERLRLVVAGNGIGRAAGTCRVIALLPPERGVYSYRIRNEVENFERVVVETDLAPPDLP